MLRHLKFILREQETFRILYQDSLSIQLNMIPTSYNTELELCNIKHSMSQAAKGTIGVRKWFRRRRGLKIWTEVVEEAVIQKQRACTKYPNLPLHLMWIKTNVGRPETK